RPRRPRSAARTRRRRTLASRRLVHDQATRRRVHTEAGHATPLGPARPSRLTPFRLETAVHPAVPADPPRLVLPTELAGRSGTTGRRWPARARGWSGRARTGPLYRAVFLGLAPPSQS